MVNITSELTGLETRMIVFLLQNITEEFSIREVARQTRTDYKLTYVTIQKLVKKGVLTKKRKANVDLCSLNLKGNLTSVCYVEMLRTNKFLDKHSYMKTFFSAIREKVKAMYYTLVVFGSFAKGKETKMSDLDLLIIAPTRQVSEEIERVVQSEALLLGRKVQTIVVDGREFVENLGSKKLNVVVEAFKNHLIVNGVEGFYNGIQQALY